ncbi:MAG: CoA pyrophosphatase [Thermoplasmata archaeon]
MTALGHRALDPAADLVVRLVALSDEPPSPARADAAVLVLLRLGKTGLEVLAEQRAERPGDPWSGQVGLPGGHKTPEDRSLTETVLRELQEEVGIRPSTLDGTPRLFDVRRARPSGLRVAVFLGLVATVPEGPGEVDPEEVATTFWLPLQALSQTESRPRATIFGEIHVDTVVFEGHVIWGFTLRVLRDIMAWLTTPDSCWSEPRGELRSWRSQAL